MEHEKDLVGMRVSDSFVELLALHDKVAVPWLDDAALGGDGPGSIYVIPGHHSHGDARFLKQEYIVTFML